MSHVDYFSFCVHDHALISYSVLKRAIKEFDSIAEESQTICEGFEKINELFHESCIEILFLSVISSTSRSPHKSRTIIRIMFQTTDAIGSETMPENNIRNELADEISCMWIYGDHNLQFFQRDRWKRSFLGSWPYRSILADFQSSFLSFLLLSSEFFDVKQVEEGACRWM